MKTMIIKEVPLLETQMEDKCVNCCLGKMNDCTIVKAWMKIYQGFAECSLGFNYQKVEE